MILGAAVDAGASISEIDRALVKLKVGGFSLGTEPDRRGGVDGTRVKVELDEKGRRPRRFDDALDDPLLPIPHPPTIRGRSSSLSSFHRRVK